MVHKIEQSRQSQLPILLTGESGCGKEVLAKLIHRMGERHAKPFVAVHCGAIPEGMLEAI